jgi:uncharacterized protein (DUF983 family)
MTEQTASDGKPSRPRPKIAEVLRRGLRRRCPRCGVGPLFQRWITTYERCSACGLLFQRNQGDAWIFIILLDRIPIIFGVVVVYFGFQSTRWEYVVAFAVSMMVPLLATIRERQGLAIALDYLSRLYFPDPSDEVHSERMKDEG